MRALEAGADDYVTKPFSPRELVARLQAALRRAGAGADEPAISRRRPGDRPRRAARSAATARSPPDADRVRAAARARAATAGRLMTHRALLQEVWGPATRDDTQTLRTHIANLRRKIEPERRRALHPHRPGRRLPPGRLISLSHD